MEQMSWAALSRHPSIGPYPGVAQLVARLVRVQEAVGSNPATRTKKKNREVSITSRFFLYFQWFAAFLFAEHPFCSFPIFPVF